MTPYVQQVATVPKNPMTTCRVDVVPHRVRGYFSRAIKLRINACDTTAPQCQQNDVYPLARRFRRHVETR